MNLVESYTYLIVAMNILVMSFVLQYIFDLQILTQPAIACSKLTIETLEQGVKYVQSEQ